MESCKSTEIEASDHFADAVKMVEIGNNAVRDVDDAGFGRIRSEGDQATKELVEVLVKDYWDNPIKDHIAFDKYMGILGVLMIKGKYPIERVQQILLQRLVLSKYTHCEVG